jgi:RNA polymerase sigma factor (sigma-70 family)
VVHSRPVSIPPFDEFFDRTGPAVHRFLVVAVGPGDADDVFQETFISALRAYPRLGRSDKLDRWILRIASRKAIDHHRSSRRRPVPVDSVPERPETPRDPGEVWDAVSALTAKQRVAVVHRYVMDMTYAEIAQTMRTSPEAARANVSAGVRRLREVLGT